MSISTLLYSAAKFGEITTNGFATLQPTECRYAFRIQGTAAHRGAANMEHAVIISSDNKRQDQALVVCSLRSVYVFADVFKTV